MTVCVGFIDENRNGVLMADSSKWYKNGDLYGRGYLKIKQMELIKKCGLINFIKPKRRSIGLAFAGDCEAIDYIIHSINEVFSVNNFNIYESVNRIGELFYSSLKNKFPSISFGLQIIIMGYCDVKNGIVVYRATLDIEKPFKEGWKTIEFCKAGMGHAQIGDGLADNCINSNTLASMHQCFLERMISGFSVALPIKYGIISKVNKDFIYIGDYYPIK